MGEGGHDGCQANVERGLRQDGAGQVRVSIVIPAFNAERWVGRAIESALAQDWPHVEVIVVNDGSTDNTERVCLSYGDRIRYHRQENYGVSVARNRGIELSTSGVVGFLDADDELSPHMVHTLLTELGQFPMAGAASGASRWREGGSGVRVPPEGHVLPRGARSGILSDFFRIYAQWHIVCTGAVLIRREVLDQVGRFRSDLRLGEDIEMWSRIAGCFPWLFVDEVVAVYNRTTESSVTMQPRLQFDFSFLYDEEEMRDRIREELWAGYRIFRRDQTLARCKVLLRYGATREVRAALRGVRPAPMRATWIIIRLLSVLPGKLARHIAEATVAVKRCARSSLRKHACLSFKNIA